jgi:hypothetical protein
MINLGEKIDVTQGARAEDGTRLEPEEQGVRHSILTGAAVRHGDDAINANMRAAIVTEMSAIEAAEKFASPCHLCVHWRPDEWQKRVRPKMESTPEGRESLNRVRGAMLSEGAASIPQLENNDDLHDVEHALGSAGVCMALSDLFRDDMITMPTSSCPTEGPDGQPLPSLFVSRRGEERRASISTRDQILRLAQGRK